MKIVRVYDSDWPHYNDTFAILYESGTLQFISGAVYGDYWIEEDMPETFSIVPIANPRDAILQHALENAGCGCSS